MTPRNTTTTERNDAVTHQVRVTQEPGVVREVTDAELTDLHRQGILHSFEHTREAAAIVPKGYEVKAKWKGAEKGADIVTAPEPMTHTEVGAADTDTKKGA